MDEYEPSTDESEGNINQSNDDIDDSKEMFNDVENVNVGCISMHTSRRICCIDGQ